MKETSERKTKDLGENKMNWILIVIGLLVVLIVLTKIKELRHHFFYKTIGVIIMLVIASVAYVAIKGSINITTYEGFLERGKTYYSWLGSLFGNLGSISGYATQQDWGLNSTISP